MPRKNKKSCSGSQLARPETVPAAIRARDHHAVEPQALCFTNEFDGTQIAIGGVPTRMDVQIQIIPRFLSGSRRCRCSMHRLQRLVYASVAPSCQTKSSPDPFHCVSSPPIEWAAHALTTTLQHVRINHGRFDILVS